MKISQAFERIFEQELAGHRNKELAFIRADERFLEQTGFSAYSNYDSYRTSRARRKKK